MNHCLKMFFLFLVCIFSPVFASLRGARELQQQRFNLGYSPLNDGEVSIASKTPRTPNVFERLTTPSIASRPGSRFRPGTPLWRPSTPINLSKETVLNSFNSLSPVRSCERDSISPEIGSASTLSPGSRPASGLVRKQSFADLMRLKVKDTQAEEEARREAQELINREKYNNLRDEYIRLQALNTQISSGKMVVTPVEVLQFRLKEEQLRFEMMQLGEYLGADLFLSDASIKQLQRKIKELQECNELQAVSQKPLESILVTKVPFREFSSMSDSKGKPVAQKDRKMNRIVTFVKTAEELKHENRHFDQTNSEDYLM